MTKKYTLIFIILLPIFIWANDSQNTISIITLNNGDSISGEILESNDKVIIIKTQYGGDIEIDKNMIIEIDYIDSSIKESVQLRGIKTQVESNLGITQEGRWRTIYLGMTTANTLYGIGIPYVLDLYESSPQVAGGFQLLMFGGSFYAVYTYTDGMDLPYGRSSFQYTGAGLGAFSILPIQAIVGFSNWYDFDENGKITWLYQMAAVPYGVILADRLYNNWELTNGQASIVSGSVPLGFFNTYMLTSILYEDGWDEENIIRLYIPLIYGGSLAHGYLAKNYVQNMPYSEDDALFLSFSGILGLYNSVNLMSILEPQDPIVSKLILLCGINGFIYLGDRLNMGLQLEKGEARIIGLGMAASNLIAAGTLVILDVEDEKIWNAYNILSATAGGYFTYKRVTKSKGYSSNNKINNVLDKLSISPTFQVQNNKIIPAVNFQMNF